MNGLKVTLSRHNFENISRQSSLKKLKSVPERGPDGLPEYGVADDGLLVVCEVRVAVDDHGRRARRRRRGLAVEHAVHLLHGHLHVVRLLLLLLLIRRDVRRLDSGMRVLRTGSLRLGFRKREEMSTVRINVSGLIINGGQTQKIRPSSGIVPYRHMWYCWYRMMNNGGVNVRWLVLEMVRRRRWRRMRMWGVRCRRCVSRRRQLQDSHSRRAVRGLRVESRRWVLFVTLI